MMALSSCACLYLIPAAATNQPPRFPVSSILFLGGGSGSGGIARGDLLVRRSPSPNFYGKRSPNSHSITITPRFRCSSQPVLDLAPATSAAYGLLLIGGGLFAYTRSGSKGSLLGGFSGGSLMLAVTQDWLDDSRGGLEVTTTTTCIDGDPIFIGESGPESQSPENIGQVAVLS
ncbi:uncharacterized protein LOC130794047 isoform X2 [Actinidia eriantha]|uniref:uncharacterized protein LOC130794047 isoform X2 n=1 Tax=Actinidia eriantha TaxID=165200 RepID=UPI00258D939A|nr:uncharacterized protein LOC130794047 isoform X2 [Actinidia eriantha]